MKPIPMKSIGDCWRACLASILEVEYDEVPYLGEPYDPSTHLIDWFERSIAFLERFGLTYFEVSLAGQDEEVRRRTLRGYHTIVGQSVRSPKIKHAVVGKDGVMVWDPFPAGGGVVPGTEVYGFFVVLDPANNLLRRTAR